MLQALYTFRSSYFLFKGFPDSSVGKESTCSAGDPSSIPGSGISTGEGIGYLFQCPWASLVAQLVKNLPAMWKTWVQSLGWEDPLEKGEATHSSILAWRISQTTVQLLSHVQLFATPWTAGCQASLSIINYSPRGHKESDTAFYLKLSFKHCSPLFIHRYQAQILSQLILSNISVNSVPSSQVQSPV